MFSAAQKGRFIGLALLGFACSAWGTTLPALSFEQITDNSDLIVSGKVTRSWAAWDAAHRYIWTHYRLEINTTHKGTPGSSVEIAEPGGLVGETGMTIAGSVAYAPGEDVVVFAQKMPNGFLRTSGWGQGKYRVDRKGLLHLDPSLRNTEIVEPAISPGASKPTSLRSLDGMTVRDFSSRIAQRLETVRREAAARRIN